MTQSHVYVIMGDITHLKCDAWMLPSDLNYTVEGHWTEAVPALIPALAVTRDDEYSAGRRFAMPVADWAGMEPIPILTAVPLTGFEDVTELGPRIAEFIRVGAEEANRRRESQDPPDKHQRIPLLAMPSFGTAGGGGSMLKGDILGVILDQARQTASEVGVDVVLVLRDEKMFALAQVLRKEPEFWSELADRDLLDEAKALAELARAGRLVPFMGAGTSVSAGAPTWAELLASLAVSADLTVEETNGLRHGGLNVLDQAAYLRSRYETANHGDVEATGDAIVARSFNDVIAKQVTLGRYGLAPALLAGLRTEQAITLNYDTLFEQASADIGVQRTVIPDSTVNGNKWLLKLHGSVTKPETIVLTRDDYLGYSASREALSAVVKATLITHHLLFVGFGLKDDHFHEIIHDVRRAFPQDATDSSALATALTLQANPLNDRLWDKKLKLISMDAATGTDGIPAAARTLEIMLDAILAFSTDSHSYLLAPEYEHALSSTERVLREGLLGFLESRMASEHATPAWAVVEKAFAELGHT